MAKLKINGVSIDMPFKPYPSQLATMSKLLSCFQTGSSGLIESPTGTGKSLSIICAVLAYAEHIKREAAPGEEKRPPIYICSRTHSQLNQLVDQLKKTSYHPRISILGSRAQYCINPRLANSADKNSACRDLIKKGDCAYFNGKERLIVKSGDEIVDIEGMRALGKRCVGCPYYASKGNAGSADVVFLPYNYLVDAKVRKATDISLNGALIVIDEAHNIEDVCRAAGSLEMTSQTLEILQNELLGAIKRSATLGEVKVNYISVLDLFKRFWAYGSDERTKQSDFFNGGGKDGKTRIVKGTAILKELDGIGVNRADFKMAVAGILKSEEGKELLPLSMFQLVEEVEKVLSILEREPDSYALCLQMQEHPRFTLNLWLLDPGIVFGPIAARAHAIALLSGTLTPFSSFSRELHHSFPHQLVAPHILQDKQAFVATISQGHLGRDLCGTYAVAETPEYLEQITKIIIDVSERTASEGGTLVFVPNYSFLARLAKKVPMGIQEPRSGGTADFERALKRFHARIAQRQPAVLLCVYRGKAAEGINFQDASARAVIAVGIPYPSAMDPQINLKREFNDKAHERSGRLWYEAQAYRALNQALGRAIRHAQDWGAILLLDSRLADEKPRAALSSWASRNIRTYRSYASCVAELTAFIANNRKQN